MAKDTLPLGELLRLLADHTAWQHDDDRLAADAAITALYGERPEPEPEPLPPAQAQAQETDRRIAEMQRQLDELRNPGMSSPSASDRRITDAERQLDDPRYPATFNSTDRRLTDAERQLDDPRSIAEAERQLAEAQRRLDEVRNRRGDVRNSDELRGSDEVRHAGFDQFGSSAVVTGPSV